MLPNERLHILGPPHADLVGPPSLDSSEIKEGVLGLNRVCGVLAHMRV